MKKKLAIIGASYLQMPIVKKAKEMGRETICFAWEEGAVCKEVADQFYPISDASGGRSCPKRLFSLDVIIDRLITCK